jgi:hypothetical protein
MEYEKVRSLVMLNKDFEYLQRELAALLNEMFPS